MSLWIGSSVTVHCGDTLGTYQGRISDVNDVKITLVKAFRNGLPYPREQVVLNASDIKDIHFIALESSPDLVTPPSSVVTVAKPIPKRANKLSDSPLIKNGIPTSTPKTKPVESPKHEHLDYEAKKEKKYNRNGLNTKDNACFNTPLDNDIQEDFDFEKNLALFNKQAIWDKLNAAKKPDVVRQADRRNFRHDENVITSLPAVYREIEVSVPDLREYVTDSGLIVPSITSELRNQLFAKAVEFGFSHERKAELMGRCASEMVLQLLGGGYRFHPQNAHQVPTVVALCGAHKQGAIGLNALRQLASHGVKTIAYLTSQDLPEEVNKEFKLYKLSKNKYTYKVLHLPSSVDFIILSLCEDTDNPPSYPLLTEWINQNRAPVLALDPPAIGTPGISTKFSLVPVLPLSHSPENGNIYLCSLGIPLQLFHDVGIKYKSPFGSKFVIPLHPKDA